MPQGFRPVDNRRMLRPTKPRRTGRHAGFVPAGLLWVVLLVGCAPDLNWRQVPIGDSGWMAWMPCKPSTFERFTSTQEPGGVRRAVQVRMQSCEAGDRLWALASADIGDPAEANLEARRWLDATAANYSDARWSTAAWQPALGSGAVAGWTLEGAGRRPDGQQRAVRSAVAAAGSRVIQLTVIGSPPDPDAIDQFFSRVSAGVGGGARP